MTGTTNRSAILLCAGLHEQHSNLATHWLPQFNLIHARSKDALLGTWRQSKPDAIALWFKDDQVDREIIQTIRDEDPKFPILLVGLGSNRGDTAKKHQCGWVDMRADDVDGAFADGIQVAYGPRQVPEAKDRVW